MSRYAHVMCETCFRKSKLVYEDGELTDAHEGGLCCWCQQAVEFSLVVNRHPDAVPCNGQHEGV